MLRGTRATNGFACLQNKDWFDQLLHDDGVIAHAPDIAQSGCSSEGNGYRYQITTKCVMVPS
eukprot:1761430-Pyramimonas_sp.AAC.1